MGKVLNCECGMVVRAEDDEELVVRARRHLDDQHPALSAQVGDDELLAMSEEEPEP